MLPPSERVPIPILRTADAALASLREQYRRRLLHGAREFLRATYVDRFYVGYVYVVLCVRYVILCASF